MTPDKESERMLRLAHFTIETAVVIDATERKRAAQQRTAPVDYR